MIKMEKGLNTLYYFFENKVHFYPIILVKYTKTTIPHIKPFSIIANSEFQESNQTLNCFVKTSFSVVLFQAARLKTVTSLLTSILVCQMTSNSDNILILTLCLLFVRKQKIFLLF